MGGSSSHSVPHETYHSNNRDEYGYSYYATFPPQKPFGEGTFRYAFQGTLRGSGPRNYEKCVVKAFKQDAPTVFDAWIPDLSVVEKADEFAQRFNGYVSRLGLSWRRLRYCTPLIAKMQQLAGTKTDSWFLFASWSDFEEHYSPYIKEQEYVAIEPFLEGEWQKFNSNGGYEVEGDYQLLPAFTHWTFDVSNHNTMICDLQGVRTEHEYLLTDPAVHSADQLYGDTDLGVVGMEWVMAAHKCNQVCRGLRLSRNPVGMAYTGRRRTTYDFELSPQEKRRNARKQSPYFEVIPE